MDLLEARIASAMLVEAGVESLGQTYKFLMDSEIFFSHKNPFLPAHRSPQWSHLPEYFSGVARENDTTFFTCKNLYFPVETLYPLNLCHSSQG